MPELRIDLDRASDVPLGVQLAWHLRARITAGALAAGDRLPAVRELAAASGVNVNTVRAVYARLEAEGLVASEHGRGTFVAARATGDERLAEIVERAAREARDAGLDPREVAAALFVNRGDRVPAEDEADEAERRRELRAEIAALERRLADPRLQRAEAVPLEPAAPSRTAAGGRILSLAELRALRDDLAARVTLLEEADRARAEAARRGAEAPAPQPERRRPPAATRTRATLTPGPVRWTLRTEEG